MQWLIDSVAWSALPQIIAIDILLGGDNAVVIAMACRNLPQQLRRKAILSGVAGAILMRILLLFFAMQLLALPGLKIAGALLLLWIGIKLMKGEEDSHDTIKGTAHLLTAIKTIVVADAVMSLDNVLAVAGAAGGDIMLVSLGVLISIPIIVWGSKLVLSLMDRWPQVIIIGAGLLGWIAGGMASSDILVLPLLNVDRMVHYLASGIGAAMVVCIGFFCSKHTSQSGREEYPPR